MLKKVRRLNWDTAGYAPHAEDAVINLADVSSVVVDTHTRRTDACVRITFRDGREMQCLGTPDDFAGDPGKGEGHE